MALRAVPDHPKFAALKARLGVPKHVALGILETLWHFAGRYTPQGNVGKYTDSEIEAWLEWGGGETGVLIQALVDSRWLDRDSAWRVLVHDWPIHADKATKQALVRSKLQFCVPTVHTPGAHNVDLSALPVPVPVPVPDPVTRKSAANGEDFVSTVLARFIPPEELAAAYQRHHKRVDGQPLHFVKNSICRMANFDLERFREVHPAYCAYWDSRDWNYSTLTLLGWIRADMPAPPPEVAARGLNKEPSSERLARVMEERVRRTGKL